MRSNSRLKAINIQYLNSIPYRALSNDPSLDYREGFPVECAAALLQGDVDLALLSTASITKHGFYEILDYGVVADGPVESVFLLSEIPFEDLRQIIIDVSSETSVILLKTILAEFYPELYQRVQFSVDAPTSIVDSISGRTGGLVIGDIGLKSVGQFEYVMDLGTEWKTQTGSPFLFAAWGYKPGTLDSTQIESFYRNVEVGLKYRALYARDWADTQGFSREEAVRYVTKVISFPITDDVRRATDEFIVRAAKHNFLPSEPISSNRQRTATTINHSFSVGESIKVGEGAIKGQRLSIGSAYNIVKALPLAKLAEITAEIRTNCKQSTDTIYYLSLEDDAKPLRSIGERMLLSPDKVVKKLESIPESSIVLFESLQFDELTFDYFKELLATALKVKRFRVGMLSVSELNRIASDTNLSLEAILGELRQSGLNFVSGITKHLLCNQKISVPLEYIKAQRVIANSGLKTISNLRVSDDISLLDYSIHLYHLRQLQDQTGSIAGHFIDACQNNSKVFSEFHTPGHYFQLICLSRLILDNVSNIAISPKVFGRPVAELLSAIGPTLNNPDDGLLRVV